MARTMADKIWDDHVVAAREGEPDLLYVDLHLVHEVTSPQAFEGLRLTKRRVRRPDLTIATMDHDVPTVGGRAAADELAERQMSALEENCRREGIRLFGMGNARQGIVHVIGPELGLTQPGLLIVCGDSHTSTHGALGALAFGIGTSEVEHVLATQCLRQRRPPTMAVTVEGPLPVGVTAKDVALGIIARIGVEGGRGHVLEYRGSTIRGLSMEGRMTVCNMTIESGARAGVIAPDDTTFAYLRGREYAPAGDQWDQAVDRWRRSTSDRDATFDREVSVDAGRLEPYVTWGTNPGQSVPVSGSVPAPSTETDERALQYMAL
ncbi:MAG: 3-isopropylmalate dehydratase large subunit, partial [Chloroflexi bacterium]